MEEDQEHTYRVVRFEVIPQSIRLEGEWGGISRGSGLDGPGLPHTGSSLILTSLLADCPSIHIGSSQEKQVGNEGELHLLPCGLGSMWIYHLPATLGD